MDATGTTARGIVIVHGIGSPAEGSHLRAYVREWKRMCDDRGVGLSVYAVERERSESGPPRVVLDINGDRIVVAEASWKDLIPEPTFVAVALWLLTVAPFTAIDLLRSSGRRFHEARSESSWSAAVFVAEAFFLRLSLGAILFPIWFAPLLTFVALSSLLPGEMGKAALGRIRNYISGVLGDSYLFVDDPVVRESVIERVRTDIELLLEECEQLSVIGHSQGGHIALSATSGLDGALKSRVEIQTWGSGYRKLRQLEQVMDHEPISSARAAAPVLGLPVVATMIFWTDGAWTLASFGFFALVLLMWWLLRLGRLYELSKRDVQALAEKAPRVWTDVWATHDLVSDGALPGQSVTSRRVVNRRSILADHSSYRSNPHLMLPVLAGATPTVARSLAASPLPSAVAGSWWTAWRLLVAVVVVCAAWAYVSSGTVGLFGVTLVGAPLLVWSRFELHWRLRRRRQTRPVVHGPFARWLGDADDAASYPWLIGAFSVSIMLATAIGTEAPAFVALDTSFGITRGFGSGRAALSSLGCLGLAMIVIVVRRAVRYFAAD